MPLLLAKALTFGKLELTYSLVKRAAIGSRNYILGTLTLGSLGVGNAVEVHQIAMAPNRAPFKAADKYPHGRRIVRTRRPSVLAERTAYLNVLIEKSPIGIAVLDSNHAVHMCNPAFERLFLFSQDELIGTNLDDLITSKDMRSDATKITRRVLAGHEVRSTTVRRRRDGMLLDVEICGVPLIVNGALTGVYGLYQDITETRRIERELRNLSGRLLRSQDEERRRIARELHDSTAQTLAGLCMGLSRLQATVHNLSVDACRRLSDCLTLAEQSAREIRTISYLLHPPLLEEIGLASALGWYVDGFSKRCGIHVDLQISPSLRRFPQEFEITIFRIVQESLANILRHSGSTTAEIRMRTGSSTLVLEIVDRGKGLVSESSRGAVKAPFGVGITGMRERLHQLGGELQIRSENKRTTVTATLPLSGVPYGSS